MPGCRARKSKSTTSCSSVVFARIERLTRVFVSVGNESWNDYGLVYEHDRNVDRTVSFWWNTSTGWGKNTCSRRPLEIRVCTSGDKETREAFSQLFLLTRPRKGIRKGRAPGEVTWTMTSKEDAPSTNLFLDDKRALIFSCTRYRPSLPF